MMTRTQRAIMFTCGAALAALVAVPAHAQITQRTGVPDNIANKLPVPPPPTPPPNYTIGPDDVLGIQVFRDDTWSGDVIVRPDGKITLKFGNDIVAAGLTPDQLKEKVVAELKKFLEEPQVTIQVKAINSRRVYITGCVAKPAAYTLTGPMTVTNLITAAGGLTEFAKKKELVLLSSTLKAKDGSQLTYKINYEDLERGRNVAKYNIELRPGDQLMVPGC